jgi:predicted MFS family arabinose efflux permease
MFLFLTFYLQGTLGYSALWAGVAFLPFSVGVAAGAAIAGRVLPRIGPRVPLAAGSALAGLGLVWFSQVGVGSSF